jgi:beta-aspartyl-peptidase (threonine type)
MGTLDFANLQVEVLGPRAALARGRWVLHFAGPGPEQKPLSGLFTVVLRLLPEGWRVVHDHSCSD